MTVYLIGLTGLNLGMTGLAVDASRLGWMMSDELMVGLLAESNHADVAPMIFLHL
jgi:hypothetical protein